MNQGDIVKIQPGNVLMPPEILAFVIRIYNLTPDRMVYFRIKCNLVSAVVPSLPFGKIEPNSRRRIDFRLQTNDPIELKICVEYCAVELGMVLTLDSFKNFKIPKNSQVISVSKPRTADNRKFTIKSFSELEQELDRRMKDQMRSSRVSKAASNASRYSNRSNQRQSLNYERTVPLQAYRQEDRLKSFKQSPRKPTNYQYQMKFRNSTVNARNQQNSYNQLQKLIAEENINVNQRLNQFEQLRRKQGSFVLNFTSFIGSCLIFFILGYLTCLFNLNFNFS